MSGFPGNSGVAGASTGQQLVDLLLQAVSSGSGHSSISRSSLDLFLSIGSHLVDFFLAARIGQGERLADQRAGEHRDEQDQQPDPQRHRLEQHRHAKVPPARSKNASSFSALCGFWP